jgi:hypothetical protein
MLDVRIFFNLKQKKCPLEEATKQNQKRNQQPENRKTRTTNMNIRSTKKQDQE